MTTTMAAKAMAISVITTTRKTPGELIFAMAPLAAASGTTLKIVQPLMCSG
ncbi:MAG: hypothetical protein ACLUEQ_04355 [Cloacibacillus evryensis]